MKKVLVDYDACRRVAYENVEDAFREGIKYIELRFSPLFMAEEHRLDPVGVVRAVCEGVDQGMRDFPVEVRLIGILSRTYGPELCWKELEAILKGRDEKVVGVDLAGDEINFPGSLFVEHFRKAREAGLHVTIHAGEATGPESIRQAVLELGAERIGHATSAPQDPSVMELLAERGIGIEVCLTSNLQTGVIKSYREHPLPIFLEQGLLATLNTDDPGISAITLEHEYRVAREEIGLSEEQINKLKENAWKVAFRPPLQP
jgi:adenosine deaminase